jgi:hypothetical protein
MIEARQQYGTEPATPKNSHHLKNPKPLSNNSGFKINILSITNT